MLLLMSDGCYRTVSPDTLIKKYRRTAGPAEAVDALVRQAMARDGTDNITVVALTLRKAF